jgi:hypothetical protein
MGYRVRRQLDVYAPSGEQPALDRRHEQMTAAEREVDLFFSDQNNLDRLIKFLALEEKKGKDKFNCYRFIMFMVRQCSAVTCSCVSIVVPTVLSPRKTTNKCIEEVGMVDGRW